MPAFNLKRLFKVIQPYLPKAKQFLYTYLPAASIKLTIIVSAEKHRG